MTEEDSYSISTKAMNLT